MRWKPKPPPRDPEPGERRTIRRFLFWPLLISSEYRWLEFATYEEMIRQSVVFQGLEDQVGRVEWRWEPFRWVD